MKYIIHKVTKPTIKDATVVVLKKPAKRTSAACHTAVTMESMAKVAKVDTVFHTGESSHTSGGTYVCLPCTLFLYVLLH